MVASLAGLALAVSLLSAPGEAPSRAKAVNAARAVGFVNGVRLSLEVPARVVRVGDLVHARASVTNTLADPVRFGGGSCQEPANEPNVQVDLRPGQPRGQRWAGVAGEFKARALSGAPYRHAMTRREELGGCLTYLRTWELAAGQTLAVPDVVWRAQTPVNSVFDGDGQIRATFRFTTGPSQRTPFEVSATVPLHMTGGDSRRLSPAGAVDAALADPAFHGFLDLDPPSTWATTSGVAVVAVDSFYLSPQTRTLVSGAVWRVILHRNENTKYGSVTIDPATGKVLRRDLPGGDPA